MGFRDPLSDAESLIRRVYAYVAYRIGAGVDAEDLTAETIERAVRYRDSYDPSRGDPAAWAIGIARRVIASHAGRPTIVSEQSSDALDDVEEATLRRLTIRDAVARLGQRDRELVALRYGADLSAREIALLLEMKTNAVEVALHRALNRLRTELGADAGTSSEELAHPSPESLR